MSAEKLQDTANAKRTTGVSVRLSAPVSTIQGVLSPLVPQPSHARKGNLVEGLLFVTGNAAEIWVVVRCPRLNHKDTKVLHEGSRSNAWHQALRDASWNAFVTFVVMLSCEQPKIGALPECAPLLRLHHVNAVPISFGRVLAEFEHAIQKDLCGAVVREVSQYLSQSAGGLVPVLLVIGLHGMVEASE